MQTNWLRKAHLYLGVFFSPLLLFFILTGWWQTVTADQDREKGGDPFYELMKKLSTIHTDDYYPHGAVVAHSHLVMKALIVAMCIALILSIVLGLWLAWIAPKGRWLALVSFVLGILVPVLLLYLA